MPPKKQLTEAQKKAARKKEAAKKLAAQVKSEAEQKLRDEEAAANEAAREAGMLKKQADQRAADAVERERLEKEKKAAINRKKKEAKKAKAAGLLEANSDEVLMAYMKYPALERARDSLQQEVRPTVASFERDGAFEGEKAMSKNAGLEEQITQLLCSIDIAMDEDEKEARQLRKALITELNASAKKMEFLRGKAGIS